MDTSRGHDVRKQYSAWSRRRNALIGAQRKPLRRRAAQPPQRASRSDSALDAHASIRERGKEHCSPDGGSRAEHRVGPRRVMDGGRAAPRQPWWCGAPTLCFIRRAGGRLITVVRARPRSTACGSAPRTGPAAHVRCLVRRPHAGGSAEGAEPLRTAGQVPPSSASFRRECVAAHRPASWSRAIR